MKKLILAAAFLFLASGALFAQTSDEAAKNKQMGAMAMQVLGQFQKQMVGTPDGGVIILSGNKLLKYDKDLNLVKEVEIGSGVEINMDSGSMQQMIEQMRQKYGKHKDSQANETK